ATSKKVWFLCANPELLMANIKKDIFLATPFRNSHLPRRALNIFVPSSAKVAETATLGPGVVLGENVVIGENTYIGANTVIEQNVSIGNNCTLHPLVYVGHSCSIGNNCEILPNTSIGTDGFGYAHDEKWNHYRIPHSGRVILEDDVHVGSNCSIDRGSIEDSIIGRGTKIDNQCHLAHNSVLGRNCLITANFAMAGSSKIGNNFVTGGSTSVTGHITITDNVQVGGMSGVTKSITEPGQYGGFPLQKMQDYLRTKAAIAKIAEMRETLRALVKNKDS
ncbi:MAG: UDP-3-O-(3-hydroxymyristoyl)glucosamine N-acyltransferase, partial [Bdellovibrionaceae bacterium]|nr:UDP-3-O-(3-hydroxymyristoyl)glucosamine N-acyltransferase [Pseudobdellovibrionaceae bacterium]